MADNPSSTEASGVWSLDDNYNAEAGDNWPSFPFIRATGGTVTTDGDYKVHTFTTSGTLTLDVGTDATYGDIVEYLVIAGGAGGGGELGGGGGAGGYLTGTSFNVTTQAYSITVGAGGAGSGGYDSPDIGASGSSSVFSTITTTGGGGGGGSAENGASGGSGGGQWVGGSSGGGAGTSGQGNAGGQGKGERKWQLCRWSWRLRRWRQRIW